MTPSDADPDSLKLIRLPADVVPQGAFTTVDGERTLMEPGDFVITPSWTFHDHGNDGADPVGQQKRESVHERPARQNGAGDHRIRDVGTIFNLVHDGDRMMVEVIEGEVQYYRREAAISLTAGQMLAVRESRSARGGIATPQLVPLSRKRK